MAFTLGYDRKHNLLLITFDGTLIQEDHRAMIAAVRAFIARHGLAHAIVDFTTVAEFKLDAAYLADFARSRSVLVGQKRVYVAPTDEIFGMLRLFEMHQSATGDVPLVVRTLAEACEHLGIDAPDFQPAAVK
jgi:hypothetical protein